MKTETFNFMAALEQCVSAGVEFAFRTTRYGIEVSGSRTLGATAFKEVQIVSWPELRISTTATRNLIRKFDLIVDKLNAKERLYER